MYASSLSELSAPKKSKSFIHILAFFKVAKENFEAAGVNDKVEVILGPAIASLENLHPEEQFDLAFIDADKESDLVYFTHAKRLLRSGGVIVR